MDTTSPGLRIKSLWETRHSTMSGSRSESCPPNHFQKAGLTKCSSVEERRYGTYSTSGDTQNWSSMNIASDFYQRLMISFCPVSIFACVKFSGNRGNFRIVSICPHYFKESLPILPRALHCHATLAIFPPCHSSETIWF